LDGEVMFEGLRKHDDELGSISWVNNA
jgi:hypothetical protein